MDDTLQLYPELGAWPQQPPCDPVVTLLPWVHGKGFQNLCTCLSCILKGATIIYTGAFFYAWGKQKGIYARGEMRGEGRGGVQWGQGIVALWGRLGAKNGPHDPPREAG